jgi:hypothetical protein
MNKVIGTLAAVLGLIFGGGIASAQNSFAWDGFYAGLGVGGASTNACSSSTLKGPSSIQPVRRFHVEYIPHRDQLLVQLLGQAVTRARFCA